ncbi:hypothetical protein [Streptococcus infantis]|uniref:hypothetical protein n=1 Tax=Streptococcus infantis TaxID=68892 RepID=UPI0039C29A3C
MEIVRNKIKEFIGLVQSYWKTSKVTMFFKPLLYILTIVIAAFRTDLGWLVILGIICVILDFIMNTYETKKFEDRIVGIEEEKEKRITELEQEKNKFVEFNSKNKKMISYLREEIEINGRVIENHLYSFLAFLHKQLKFTRSERISVYVRDEEENNFRIVGRYSTSPNYNKIGRESYAGDKGFISKCWDGDSDDFVKILPKHGTSEYYSEQFSVGYSKDELEKLSMKSRFFYVLNISRDGRPSIGVLVIESTKDRLDGYPNYEANEAEEKFQKRFSADIQKYSQYLYDVMDTKRIIKSGEGLHES